MSCTYVVSSEHAHVHMAENPMLKIIFCAKVCYFAAEIDLIFWVLQ